MQRIVFIVVATVLWWFFPEEVSARQLYINEVMAANNTIAPDEDGDYEDWIEIYYSGDEAIHLKDYGLSDDVDIPFRWTFPDITLNPGDFLLIWASGKNRRKPGENLHTNFAIDAEGEPLVLTRPDGFRMDEMAPVPIPPDISLGRRPGDDGSLVYFREPTPGGPNRTESIRDLLETPLLSHQTGFYTSGFDLELSHPEEGVTLHYTLDGSTPTRDSPVYTEPIPVADRSGEPNRFSTIPTNDLENWRRFREPSGPVPKGTTVRVLAVKEGYFPSLSSHTFFVFPEGKDRHSLPVISIITDSLNFFGHEAGIYVPGIHYQKGREDTGNYYQRGRAWEREAAMEFFDENGKPAFNQNVGLRIHGGFTRRFSQKSLRVYARSEYGENRIRYPVFPDLPYESYKRFILRNSGNDQGYSMFRDAAAQAVVRHFNMDTQAYRPVIVYVNGEYWGLHNIRERYDRHYLERTYGVDPDHIDLLTGRWTVQEGKNNQYQNVLHFIESRDLAAEENMEHVETLIDIDNLLDYYTAKIFFANTDWPHNNIDFWRLRTDFDPDAPPGHDGRWRWMFYDLDFTMGLITHSDHDMFHHLTRRYDDEGLEWPNLLFRNLIVNESFRRRLINRIADHLNTTFQPTRVKRIIEQIKSSIEPEMADYSLRWSIPANPAEWRETVEPMYRFAEDRPEHLRQHIRNHFDIESTEMVSIDVSNPLLGHVKVNSLSIVPGDPGLSGQPYPWEGIYFSGVPISLKAEPGPGHAFSHWLIDGTTEPDSVIVVQPEEIQSVTAVFLEQQSEDIPTHRIAESEYFFRHWESEEPGGSYPPSMGFVYMDERDPGLEASVGGLVLGGYNLDSRTRINGLGEDGFSFLNTSSAAGNPGYPGTRLGGAILALDTREVAGAEVGFEAGTVAPNSRVYHLRLQYRIGSEGAFRDVPDVEGRPVEYRRNEQAGHRSFLGPVALPEEAIGHRRVELLWRYYYSGERVDEQSGQRTELHISAIHVNEKPLPGQPPAHRLEEAPYGFTSWPADTSAGTNPPSMGFVYMSEPDPGRDAVPLGYTSGAYDLDSRTRVNGLGEDGVGFINTSNLEGNPGYPGRRLGGAVLALNTEGRGSVSVEWTGGTVAPNSRIYHLRLQYRIGSEGAFRDVPDGEGRPVEYRRNGQAGHSERLGPVLLPAEAEDQPRVELLWRYYYSGDREDDQSGRRSMLRLSRIRVTSYALLGGDPGPPESNRLYQNYPNPFYPHTRIRYDLARAGDVRLDLYTIGGRHVGGLQQGPAEAGRHAVEVDATGLASGIYLYRLVSGSYSATGKMSVIK